MSNKMSLAELRELFLSAPESPATRILAIALSLILVTVVLGLVRRGTLREEYTPIWMAVALGIFLLSASSSFLHAITRAVGAWTSSSTLFFFGQLFLVAISLNYAVRLSRLTLQVKNLSQELAVMRAEYEVRDTDPRTTAQPSAQEGGTGSC